MRDTSSRTDQGFPKLNRANFALAGRCIALLTLSMMALMASANSRPSETADPPNIVFVIMDDVGVDQLQLYAPGGSNAPSTPSIDFIAGQGVTFTNAWAMPECSPTRSAFFTGRFGLRTGVTTAITPNMLPQAQVSPYETTLPRVLRTAGYSSAMLGKYHLGSSNPSGNCSPATRGFDFFDGNMEAGPPSIDSQAGSANVTAGTYDCGFVRGPAPLFASVFGACYFADGQCQDNMTGKMCMRVGGLLNANSSCADKTPEHLDFDRANGYYVWPESVTVGALAAPSGCVGPGDGCADLNCPMAADIEPGLSREFLSGEQTLGAVDWWHKQAGPRMLTVSYNSIHTPFQPPPSDSDDDPVDARVCQGENANRGDNLALSKAMLEDLDRQLAQLLAGLNLATLDNHGKISALHLDEMNTMLVIVGDNGTFGPIVRLPYDPTRAKGSVFQTGVLMPLLVAGPLLTGKGREVPALVNAVDLFELFSEFAGLKVREIVPPAHRLDSQPMLQQLTTTVEQPGRKFNYAEVSAENSLAVPIDPQSRFWPCVLQSSITQDMSGDPLISGGICVDLLFETKSFCEEDNGGAWFGPGTSYPNPNAVMPANPQGAWGSCCSVHAAYSNSDNVMRIAPLTQRAVQTGEFKLVELDLTDCDAPLDDGLSFPPFERMTTTQFYDLGTVPIDYRLTEVCSAIDGLTPDTALKCGDGIASAALPNGDFCANAPECLWSIPKLGRAFSELKSRMNGVTLSAINCPGDGNLDKRVTQLDIEGVLNFTGTGPSYFDFNKDGQTDDEDLAIAQANIGLECLGACRRADLNGDNRVTKEDAALLRSSFGSCDSDLASDRHLCAGDLDGDGLIGGKDLQQLNVTRKTTDGLACAINVMGQNDATQDAQAIQNAIDTAALDPSGGRVQLDGFFDLGDCSFCVTIHGPVIIEGSGDPFAEENPETEAATIITTTGISPFVISDQSSGEGVIHIERLWFRGGRGTALSITQLRGRLELVNNRVTGFSSIIVDDVEFRFDFLTRRCHSYRATVIPGRSWYGAEYHTVKRPTGISEQPGNRFLLGYCR